MAAHRVLVVDDDQALGEAIAAALGRSYEVHCARTGSEAISALCESVFDLILLDHRLPDLLGTDLLKLIKRFFPATTVVFITGQGSEDVAADALRWGARDYLRKPFKLDDLMARVDSLFTVRRSGHERRHDPYLQFLDQPTSDGRPDRDPDRSRGILRTVQYVEGHLNQPLTLTEVARLAGMSRFHFCRQFKKTTGLSFRAYLLQKRIARAKDLLRDSSRSIGDVAREVGFQDLTHFGRVFRKIAHILPREFRRLSAKEPW